MGSTVTVAIPVLNGGPLFAQVLQAVAAQRLDSDVEILICDSGSEDGSPRLAKSLGASVIEIDRRRFSHGGTRNLLMERAGGDLVAFLTQDAVPADEWWLSRLLDGFGAAKDVGLTFGPYRPRPDASIMVARELTAWFSAFAPDSEPHVDRLAPDERELSTRALLGRRGFFTDANGCVRRSAWEQVRFREISYAEDHALAHDMLRAGFAKVFVPGAAVIHSHEYSAWEWLQRAFDEARAIAEIYGWSEPVHPRTAALNVWGRIRADWRWSRAHSGAPSGTDAARLLLGSAAHHVARTTGAILGARAGRLPRSLAKRLSHERRPG